MFFQEKNRAFIQKLILYANNTARLKVKKLASSEAHRTEIASLELQLREQESRNNMFSSEIRTLKEES